MRSRIRAVAAAAAVVLLLASCGGGGGGGGVAYKEPKGAATETITLEAGNFYFKPDKIEASPGIANLEIDGQGGLHTLVFDNGKYPGFQLEVAGNGDSDAKKIDLKPGKYNFYCDITGHRQMGMEGTLTVAG